MIVTTLAPPAAEPVGLAEAKDYLRIAGDTQDELVAGLIGAARSRIEELTGVMMITRSLRVAMDWWPRGTVDRRWMRLPVRPAQSLIAVRVFDGYGNAQAVTSRLRCRPGVRRSCCGSTARFRGRDSVLAASRSISSPGLARSLVTWRRVCGWR